MTYSFFEAKMAAGKDDHMTLMNIRKIQNTTRVLRVLVYRQKLFYMCCLLLLCARAVCSVLLQQGNTSIKLTTISRLRYTVSTPEVEFRPRTSLKIS